ncbi:hypothetical protein FIU97_07605 [Roseivivax sp. THAF40]|uniref:hypothetical protein n=1 Tax=unclassified Roseivivax TaxID=2639302 RepID=UPI001267E92C|nr:MULTISPECIES: hypothetical protein [unclassified Roseivivax]QFS82661.1 hypothetical protein FIV09_07500 [Roseivivax sp. THAF197b]QFT46430.1 hypothetical protein FIU97_07605 [Roseivivax sp. THAF40]
MTTPNYDPKGLIREAYRIEGIDEADCRTIFLDWALGLPLEIDNATAIREMLAQHGTDGHPMTAVLQEGLMTLGAPRRRGGWRSRH